MGLVLLKVIVFLRGRAMGLAIGAPSTRFSGRLSPCRIEANLSSSEMRLSTAVSTCCLKESLNDFASLLMRSAAVTNASTSWSKYSLMPSAVASRWVTSYARTKCPTPDLSGLLKLSTSNLLIACVIGVTLKRLTSPENETLHVALKPATS